MDNSQVYLNLLIVHNYILNREILYKSTMLETEPMETGFIKGNFTYTMGTRHRNFHLSEQLGG